MRRLLKPAQFQAVLRGTVAARTPHFVLHALHWPQEGTAAPSSAVPIPASPLFAGSAPMLGVLVPKRWARRAVTRNLIKRQMRAVAAAHEAGLPARTALVLRLRSEFDRRRFVSAASDALRAAVRTELQQLFTRAQWPASPVASPGSPPGFRPRPESAPGQVGAQTPSGTMRRAP